MLSKGRIQLESAVGEFNRNLTLLNSFLLNTRLLLCRHVAEEILKGVFIILAV